MRAPSSPSFSTPVAKRQACLCHLWHYRPNQGRAQCPAERGLGREPAADHRVHGGRQTGGDSGGHTNSSLAALKPKRPRGFLAYVKGLTIGQGTRNHRKPPSSCVGITSREKFQVYFLPRSSLVRIDTKRTSASRLLLTGLAFQSSFWIAASNRILGAASTTWSELTIAVQRTGPLST